MALMILFFFIPLIIPFLIVGFWRRRPVWAFIVAAVFAMLLPAATGIVKTVQALHIYGAGDPQLMAGGISEALVTTLLSAIVYLPLLFGFQWIIRRHFRDKDAEKLAEKNVQNNS